MRRFRPLAVAIPLIAAPALATPSMRLTYLRGAGSERCPDERALRHAVEQRLGYDPFFPWANRTIVARIEAGAHELSGNVDLVDAAGLVVGTRTLSSPASQCAELVSGMALAISIAIDPSSADRTPKSNDADSDPDADAAAWSTARAAEAAAERQGERSRKRAAGGKAPPGPNPPAPPVGRDVVARTPPPAPPARATHWTAEFGFGAAGAVAATPGAALGPALGVAARQGAWSIGVEGRYLFAFDAHETSASLFEGTLLGCFQAGFPFACVEGTAGRLAVSGNGIRSPRNDHAAILRLGPRLGVDLPLSSAIALRAYADVAFNLVRQSVEVDAQATWNASIVSGFAGIAAVGRFP